MLQWVNSYEAQTSSSLIVHVQLKLKYWLFQPTHDDTIKPKEVYIQPSFSRKLALRF